MFTAEAGVLFITVAGVVFITVAGVVFITVAGVVFNAVGIVVFKAVGEVFIVVAVVEGALTFSGSSCCFDVVECVDGSDIGGDV